MRHERNMERNVGSRYLEKNKNDYRTRGKNVAARSIAGRNTAKRSTSGNNAKGR